MIDFDNILTNSFGIFSSTWLLCFLFNFLYKGILFNIFMNFSESFLFDDFLALISFDLLLFISLINLFILNTKFLSIKFIQKFLELIILFFFLTIEVIYSSLYFIVFDKSKIAFDISILFDLDKISSLNKFDK